MSTTLTSTSTPALLRSNSQSKATSTHFCRYSCEEESALPAFFSALLIWWLWRQCHQHRYHLWAIPSLQSDQPCSRVLCILTHSIWWVWSTTPSKMGILTILFRGLPLIWPHLQVLAQDHNCRYEGPASTYLEGWLVHSDQWEKRDSALCELSLFCEDYATDSNILLMHHRDFVQARQGRILESHSLALPGDAADLAFAFQRPSSQTCAVVSQALSHDIFRRS